MKDVWSNNENAALWVRVKNYDQFIHYKSGRTAPWVKFPKSFCDNPEVVSLSDQSFRLFMIVLSIASQDGDVCFYGREWAKITRLPFKNFVASMSSLLVSGLLQQVEGK